MKIKPLQLAIPLFFSILILPLSAEAYLTTEFNKSYAGAGTNYWALRCSNYSGTFYCYAFFDNKVIRFNSTCDAVNICTPSSSIPSQLALRNDGNAVAKTHNGQSAVNITFDTSTCAVGSLGSLIADFDAGGIGATYEALNWTYWGTYLSYPTDVGRLTETYNLSATIEKPSITNPFNVISLPNRSDNTTFYLSNITNGNIYKYVNGVNVITIADLYSLYGIAGAQYNYDLIKIGGTTYIYFANKTNCYRANMTYAEGVGLGTTLTAIYPTYSAPAGYTTLVAYINTELGGTLRFYFNGTNIANSSVPTNTSSNYSASAGNLEAGAYTWYAVYTDSMGNLFSTETITFTTSTTSYEYFVQNPAGYFAALTGSFFSITDLATSKILSSVIFSLFFTLGVFAGMTYATKKHMTIKMDAFVMIYFIFLIMFSLMGWFPTWIIILLILIGALAFVKTGKFGG